MQSRQAVSSHCSPNMCKSSRMAVNQRNHCLQRRMRDTRQESGVFGSQDHSRQLSSISVVSFHNHSYVSQASTAYQHWIVYVKQTIHLLYCSFCADALAGPFSSQEGSQASLVWSC